MDGNDQPQQPQPDAAWRFNPGGDQPAPPAQPVAQAPTAATPPLNQQYAPQAPAVGGEGTITWTASEFIDHHKTTGWFITLIGGSIAIAVIVWFITKDIITSISIVAAAGLLAGFAGRQPRELTYRIDRHGLQVGQRFYDFGSFQSFAIMGEGAFGSVVFTPLKRFAPLLTIYFDPKDERKIVEALSQFLPIRPRKPDPIDKLMWRIRF